MAIKALAESFILGLTFGWGPCLASCGPLLLAYIAGTGKNPVKSLGAYSLFSVSRILVYLALGLMVFFFGRIIFERYSWFFKFILAGSGAFIIFLGLLMLLGKEFKSDSCSFLYKNILEKDKKSIITLGLAAGLLPCAPLVTMLAYAGLVSRNVFENSAYIVSFGLGTAVSPLIALTALAGLLPSILGDGSQAKAKVSLTKLFNIICGLIIIILGAQLMRRVF